VVTIESSLCPSNKMEKLMGQQPFRSIFLKNTLSLSPTDCAFQPSMLITSNKPDVKGTEKGNQFHKAYFVTSKRELVGVRWGACRGEVGNLYKCIFSFVQQN